MTGEPSSVRQTEGVAGSRDYKIEVELVGRGVEIGDIRHFAGEWIPGADPEHRDYASFADPDGNLWVLREVHHNT
jgi:hypothetical protein